MGYSDGPWGELATHNDELGEVWDGYALLPDPGENVALDAFVERKSITIASLVRMGARLSADTVLAFAFPGGIKFRNIVTDRRWSYEGSTWHQMKIIRADREPTSICIVAEGETDGAWLSDHYPVDVAVLPAGADPRPHTQAYAEQLAGYELVLLAQDQDRAGDEGAGQLIELLPRSLRFAPPESNDWCDSPVVPELPDPTEATSPVMEMLVPAGELLALEPPEIISHFEGGVLPVGGQLILHGWAKSYKSFLSLDLVSALAQGQDWCGFEPTEEPARVAVMQYEIPWPYYQQRVKYLMDKAREPELMAVNFLTWTPLQRPTFRAGNQAQEDLILKTLVDAGVSVFLLDPVRRATGAVDLNSEKDVRPLLQFYERIQDQGITVVTCHHDNKTYARAGGGNPLGMTGVGAFAGDADTIVSVSVPPGKTTEDPQRNLHFTFRNAPSIGARGMEMGGDGSIVYSTEPHGDWEADDSGQPAI